MGKFQYEWWTVDIKEACGRIRLEVKAKNKENAIKQIKEYADYHTKYVQSARPDFETEVFWDTLALDHKGYQRRF